MASHGLNGGKGGGRVARSVQGGGGVGPKLRIETRGEKDKGFEKGKVIGLRIRSRVHRGFEVWEKRAKKAVKMVFLGAVTEEVLTSLS